MEIGIFVCEKLIPTEIHREDNRGLEELLEKEQFMIRPHPGPQEAALVTYSRPDGSCFLIHHAYARFGHHLGSLKWKEIHCNRFDVVSECGGIAQEVLITFVGFYLQKGYHLAYLRVYPNRPSSEPSRESSRSFPTVPR